MIIGIILRAIFFYFLWQLGRKLWSSYIAGQKAKPSTSEHFKASSKGHSSDVFEADFRVINEQDS